MKSILIMSILIHIHLVISGQQVYTDSIKPAITEKKWSFSINLGASVVGAGASLNREMKEIGFDDSPPDFDFFGLFSIKNNKEYPQVRKSASWDMETRMNLSARSALAFSLGKSHLLLARQEIAALYFIGDQF